jgi:hypothetical protein
MNHERLPKCEWTKMEDDTWYLGPFIDEIENEKVERTYTSGLKVWSRINAIWTNLIYYRGKNTVNKNLNYYIKIQLLDQIITIAYI